MTTARVHDIGAWLGRVDRTRTTLRYPGRLTIYRPATGQILAHGWSPPLLQANLGARIKLTPEYALPDRAYMLARPHLLPLITAATAVGEVLLITEHFQRRTCVSACWDANPDTTAECVCGCAGANHGTGHGLDGGVIVDGAEYGDLSIVGGYLVRRQLLPRTPRRKGNN